MNNLTKFAFRAGLFLCLALFLDTPGHARAPQRPPDQPASSENESDQGPSIFFEVTIGGDGSAEAGLYSPPRFVLEQDFVQILSRALDCPFEQKSRFRGGAGKGGVVRGTCQIPLRITRLQRAGQLDLKPLKDFQSAAQPAYVGVDISVPDSGFFRCVLQPGGTAVAVSGRTCSFLLERAEGGSPTVDFEFGYEPRQAARIAGTLGFLLLLPLPGIFWLRRLALRAPEEAKPSVRFAYFRFLNWTALFGALGWWTAVDLLHADDFLGFLISNVSPSHGPINAILAWCLLWLAPAGIYFACLALSSPIDALHGTRRTRRQILEQSFWSIGRFVLPLSLLALAIAELFTSARAAVLLFAASVASARLARLRLARAFGIELYALTSGELRDRAFAIAKQAGAKLNQLYVVPTVRWRMANAFAHIGRNIILTDYLVRNLSKREVDAVIGHEMTHLQQKHIRGRLAVLFVAIVAFAFGGVWFGDRLPAHFPQGPVTFGLVLLTVFFVSRRGEFAADAGSVKLTGDAEAMITGLAKISRLNTMPIHWGKLDEKMLTHPSTQRRIAQLGRTAGFAPERVAGLLQQSAAPAADCYPLPATAQPAGKVFSTFFKSRVAWRNVWSMALTIAALPSMFALAAVWMRLEGAMLWLTYAAGFGVTLAAASGLSNLMPTRGLGQLETLLRKKIAAEGVPGANHGLFVGLAPGAYPRLYEGNWAWDVGILYMTADALAYCGEESRFVLQRTDVTRVASGAGPATWFDSCSACLYFRDSSGGESTLNLRALRARTMRELARKTRMLARDLSQWHQAMPASIDPILTKQGELPSLPHAAGMPAFGLVTSISPRSIVRGVNLVRDFVFHSFVALGIAVLAGLGLPLTDALAMREGDPVWQSALGLIYVLGVVWLMRAFLFIPFWRMPNPAPPHRDTSGAAGQASGTQS